MRRAPQTGLQSTFGWRAVSRRWLAVLSSVGLVLGLAVASGLGSGVANAAGGAIYNVKVNTGATYTTSGGAVPVVTEEPVKLFV